MSDLGFLPAVRRLLEQTPKGGQRLLFSATLDGAVNTLVKRFLSQPVTHEADSAQSPVAEMTHHVLHVQREQRIPVLVDLTSAAGRTVVFTRTKHGAKALARQLNKSGVPSVELHGNLSQNARTRNMEAFHAGEATTLVATDIAARGIHVDDVALVVHADPPVEHKAYLHRSGRTARAGNEGTVVTLMTDDQVRDVRALTKAAGISADHDPGARHRPPGADPARPRRAGAGARRSRDRRPRLVHLGPSLGRQRRRPQPLPRRWLRPSLRWRRGIRFLRRSYVDRRQRGPLRWPGRCAHVRCPQVRLRRPQVRRPQVRRWPEPQPHLRRRRAQRRLVQRQELNRPALIG